MGYQHWRPGGGRGGVAGDRGTIGKIKKASFSLAPTIGIWFTCIALPSLEGHPGGMFPLLLVPAQVAAPQAAAVPAFPLPPALRIRPGSLKISPYDREVFEVRSPDGKDLGRAEMDGRVSRFSVDSSQGPMGTLSLMDHLKPWMEAQGWVWRYAERGVAQLKTLKGECWVRIQALPRGEISVTLLEPGGPRKLSMAKPGKVPELPRGNEDFPYLAPWPGARLASSKVLENPVPVDLGDGKQLLVRVNWIEKTYALDPVPTSFEFLEAYAAALEAQGWEIEGKFKGRPSQLQAFYAKDGRDIRATLSLWEQGMAISVADVGAQRPR